MLNQYIYIYSSYIVVINYCMQDVDPMHILLIIIYIVYVESMYMFSSNVMSKITICRICIIVCYYLFIIDGSHSYQQLIIHQIMKY